MPSPIPARSPLLARLLLAALAWLPVAGCTAGPPPAADLWNGRNLDGWQLVLKEPAADPAAIATPGRDGACAVTGVPTGYLATRESYADYELAFDWRWTGKPGNSGLLLHLGPPDQDRVWPRCVQLQTKSGTAGELIPMEGFTFAEPLPPKAKGLPRAPDVAEAAPGEWNSCRIVCRGDTVECWINGRAASRATRCSSSSGRIGIQLEGVPFEFRGLRLRRL